MQLKRSFTITEIQIGMTASYSQTITDADIKGFSGLSGDHNPVHVNEEYAKKSRYKGRIAHGLLTASFFLRFLGQNFLAKVVFMLVRICNLKGRFI